MTPLANRSMLTASHITVPPYYAADGASLYSRRGELESPSSLLSAPLALTRCTWLPMRPGQVCLMMIAWIAWQVASMVAALSQLAAAYQAVADQAAAKALSAFQAQQDLAASPSSPQHDPQAKPAASAEAAVNQPRSSSHSSGPQQESGGDTKHAGPKQRYPDHVHDPLKVQHDLGSAKAAALQCITELYRGLLYVVLYHCHGQRRV